MAHPLDRPVWSALSGRQKSLSLGDDRARRLAPAYGAFAAGARASREGQAALAALPCDENGLLVVETESVSAPAGLEVAAVLACVQMVAGEVAEVRPDVEVLALGDADAAEMLALAQLTRPGPFFSRTHQLGQFIGVRDAGRLVAMAGERLRPEGFAEVSGVCVHPESRGRGYAAALSSIVGRRILARGETPFLHALDDNWPAIRLYEGLGFSLRRKVMLTVLRQAVP